MMESLREIFFKSDRTPYSMFDVHSFLFRSDRLLSGQKQPIHLSPYTLNLSPYTFHLIPSLNSGNDPSDIYMRFKILS